MSKLDDTVYLDIIKAYRNGLVPSKGIENAVVGLEAEAAEILSQLDYVEKGNSDFKFIDGCYGSGKTFLCSLIREKGFAGNFLVSALTISQEAPLHKFEIFYNKIMEGIRTKQKRSACALGDIIEMWLFELEEKLAELHSIDTSIKSYHLKLPALMDKAIEEDLKVLSSYDSSFTNAFRSYYHAKQTGDNALAQSALGWLKGETKLPGSLKKKITVKKEVDIYTSLNFLKAFLNIIKRIGYSGLIILVDELETIQRLPNQSQRYGAYENLRLLLDKIANKDFINCYFLFTGTDSLFEDDFKGIPSYEALGDRIKYLETNGNFRTLKQPIIKLEGFNRDKLIEVAKKLTEFHGAAYKWNARHRFPDKFIHSYAEYTAENFGGEINTVPRGFLREYIHLLDLGSDNPDFDPFEHFLKDKESAARIKESETIQSHLISI